MHDEREIGVYRMKAEAEEYVSERYQRAQDVACGEGECRSWIK
jgi:hypothetical protein